MHARCSVAVGDSDATRWTSVTFVGARHRLTFRARDDAACAAWLAGLSEAELALRGHLVGDVVVTSVVRGADGAQIVLEALTLEV